MKTKFFAGIFISSLILFLTSCKKHHDVAANNTSTDYYVKIKKSGTWITYPSVAGELGPDLANAAYTDLGVTAQSADASQVFDISIQISGSNFTTGTYASDNTGYTTEISFDNQVGGTLSDYQIEDASGMAPSKYTVVITEITSTTIKGTFTGNYLSNDFGSGTDIAEVTEGQFYVKRVR